MRAAAAPIFAGAFSRPVRTRCSEALQLRAHPRHGPQPLRTLVGEPLLAAHDEDAQPGRLRSAFLDLRPWGRRALTGRDPHLSVQPRAGRALDVLEAARPPAAVAADDVA